MKFSCSVDRSCLSNGNTILCWTLLLYTFMLCCSKSTSSWMMHICMWTLVNKCICQSEGTFFVCKLPSEYVHDTNQPYVTNTFCPLISNGWQAFVYREPRIRDSSFTQSNLLCEPPISLPQLRTQTQVAICGCQYQKIGTLNFSKTYFALNEKRTNMFSPSTLI